MSCRRTAHLRRGLVSGLAGLGLCVIGRAASLVAGIVGGFFGLLLGATSVAACSVEDGAGLLLSVSGSV